MPYLPRIDRVTHAVATLALIAVALLPRPVAAQPVGTDVTHLFNGRDLTNFYTWLVGHKRTDPDGVFTVLPDRSSRAASATSCSCPVSNPTALKRRRR
jgi:hypothetical protein